MTSYLITLEIDDDESYSNTCSGVYLFVEEDMYIQTQDYHQIRFYLCGFNANENVQCQNDNTWREQDIEFIHKY